MNTTVQPVIPSERIHAIDILRGIALFGVLVVNLVNEFRVSLFAQFVPMPATLSSLDGRIEHVISMFFEMKAFALFSLLFGVGLAIQSERLMNSDRRWRLLLRRMIALLAMGLIHLLLIWNGDILTEYALVGLVALLFLRLPAQSMLLAAMALLAFHVILPALPLPVIWPGTAWLQQHVVDANQVYAAGTYAEIIRFSWRELPYILPLHVYVLPRTLGLFLLGMLAWQTGVLTNPRAHRVLLLAVASVGLIVGTIMGAPDALEAVTSWKISGIVVSCLANASSILMGLGYGAAIISLVEFTAAARILRAFAPLGRMAFTNYLMQSLIFSGVFFGYGLGYFGRLEPAQALAFGIAVYVVQMVLSALWLRRYRFGPVEWLWRTLMYGVRQPMTLPASER